MDTLKHSASTGSHEVHLCHRCNWPFPNPHPSSRHRRAHKRVCGTIKGYEIDQSHSVVSDDSDDNEHNPSPIVDKAHSDDSKGVFSISGVGKYSRAKSEEDVFSDAITEFSDGEFNPQIENKIIEGDLISTSSSQLKVVDDSVDRTEQLNDPTSIDQTYKSGAMVNAMDHFEGVALISDKNIKPISVGHGNGLQPDIDELGGDKGAEKELVKAKVENATQTEGVLDSSTLDCEEEKPLDPVLVATERKDLVTEGVKHDSSGQTDTFEEKDATKELKTEVSDSIDCSSVVPLDSLIDKEGNSGSFDTKEDEAFADKQVKTEFLNGSNENGEEVTKETQERLDSAVQSDHSTGIPSDLYSNAEISEEGSKLESNSPESRDKGMEIPTKESESETPSDIQVKADAKEVESVDIAGIELELKKKGDISELRTPEHNDSEILYSNAEISEEGSKLESSSPESRDKGIKIPTKESESETPSDIQVKADAKEVESVDIAGIEPELKNNGDISELRTPEQNDSEILPKISENENKCATDGEMSNELNPDGNLAVPNANSEIMEESSLDDGLEKKLPSGEEHTDENFTFTPVLDKSIASPVNFQVVHESSTACANNGENISVDCKSLQDEDGDVNPSKENGGGSAMDHSTAKSISVVPETTSTEDKSETNSQEPKTSTDKIDDFEPPSFMTLVNHASEIETEQQATQHPKTDALQAGWFPSLTSVVNESEGRKKNEEKIAKVTKHIPLKNLLIEAKSPNPKQIPSMFQKEEDSAKENGADAMKVNSAVDAVEGKEMDKEWDSPAKYPIESKKEKKKKKGFWMPFACCSSSVHRDLQ